MRNIFSLLFISIFLSCNLDKIEPHAHTKSYTHQEKAMDLDTDLLDAYQLKIGKTFLYGNYETFISDFGMPTKVTIGKTDFTVTSKIDLDGIVATAKEPTIVTFHYPGIDMWYTHDSNVIPFSIDFRKTEKSVTYERTTFNATYSIEQFSKQFPKSANPSFTSPQSLFEITTKEKGKNFKHFMLLRKSKDDPKAMPTIEFTFDHDKLIFIVFANF